MTQETGTPSEQPQEAIPSLCRDCLSWFDRRIGICAHCGSPRTIGHPELAEMAIAHIDCDAFYAAIEKRDDPTLKDKPVIVGHLGGRGAVTPPHRSVFGSQAAMGARENPTMVGAHWLTRHLSTIRLS